MAGPEFPSLPQMAGNMAGTITDVVKTAIQTGNIFASEEMAKIRLDICKACEFFDTNSARCNQCGCFMTTKVKVIAAFCPKNKWPTKL